MELSLIVTIVSLAITVISLIVTFITVWKKKGWKAALLAMMRTIQKVKVDQETEGKVEAAITIANEIKEHWDKNSNIKSVAKVGAFIDEVYHAQVEDINKWKDKVEKSS